MNQILVTNDPEPEKKSAAKNNQYKYSQGGKKDISTVIKVFAIIIILVAVAVIGIGTYMFTDITKKFNTETGTQAPTVKQEILENNKLKITVLYEKGLKQISYMWGDINERIINCEGKKEVELTLDIPLGKNNFKFTVEDIEGKKTVSERDITVDYGIAISINGNKTKIEAKGKEEFKYMTYSWNEGEEIKVEIEKNEFSQEIDTPKGENILTVAFVDINNETIQKTQTIKGVLEPIILMEYVGKDILFKLEDEEQLNTFKILKNGKEIYTEKLEEALFEYTLPSTEFKHKDKIEAKVTNLDGVETILSRPVLSVKYDETGDNIEIKGKDEIELKELKVTINDDEPQVGVTDQKEFIYKYPVKDLKAGDNMKIKVTNSKNVINQITVKLK